jgi:hypothetical protein
MVLTSDDAVKRYPRILRLPPTGCLLVCTDLHGNLKDFQRMRSIFEACEGRGEAPFLLFTGDLIHGPNGAERDWPEFLGTYFRDESAELLEEYLALARKRPSRVACLLGNHEHSHVGGPHTPKFWADETEHFEESVGARKASRFRKAMKAFPLAAVTPCGVAVLHGAPNAVIAGPETLEALRYDGYEGLDVNTMYGLNVLGQILWSRGASPEVARRFLDALGRGGSELRVCVYGHDIVTDGFERSSEEQLVLSTSFGVRDRCKTYLKIDLGGRYASSLDLREGVELLGLYD